jgi:hypothetical protein
VTIEHGWFDGDFVRRWTNGPLLVRADAGPFLRASELSPPGDPAHYVAWDDVNARPVQYDPARGRHAVDEARLALFGAREVSTRAGSLLRRPAFDLVAEQCRPMAPAVAEVITGGTRGRHRARRADAVGVTPDDPVRGGGPEDRVRDQPGGPVAGPAARTSRTCAR